MYNFMIILTKLCVSSYLLTSRKLYSKTTDLHPFYAVTISVAVTQSYQMKQVAHKYYVNWVRHMRSSFSTVFQFDRFNCPIYPNTRPGILSDFDWVDLLSKTLICDL